MHAEQEAGIYTWCLNTDTVYGDTAVADLFGIDPARTLNGLPIANYMERVHPEDRATLAKSISEAILNGSPYRSEYRVFDTDGRIREVMAFGRCFRDETGNPAYYAGIVHPIETLL